MPLPLFPVSVVGSWPRTPELLSVLRQKRRGGISQDEFDGVADAAVLEALRLQTAAGVDVVTDGEQRRDNFYSFVAEKLSGVRLMSLSEMLDVVEDRAGFEDILETLGVPAYAILNPTCIGRLERKGPLAVDEARFLREHTDKPIKVALPGPYLLTRAMFVPGVSKPAYDSKEELAEDVVAVLRAEVEELASEGVDFVQLDEPVLTELVFSRGKTRTFMCAALASRGDPTEELEFAVSLINRVVDGVSGVRTGLHVCRGNWSRNEATLLRGSYQPLAPYLARLCVDQLVLEYATERAGVLMAFEGKEIGLGVVNPRTESIESSEHISKAVSRALELYPSEKVWLNPDCGFGTFSARPVNTAETAVKKLAMMAEAAQMVREAAAT
ncbi:MAG: cobalamin-independent methionine synthase II family protein [SAR202 cluster bacterium]|nr:cobalamin-independent methionine synthase II family protein [SAR202 cluster bacterium]